MASSNDLIESMLGYALGAVLGRWDMRMALDASLAPKLQGPFDPLPVCSPGMLVGPDGLPARSGSIVSEEWLRARPDVISLPPEGSVARPTIPDSEYPLRIDWDGILVDDESHPDDVVVTVIEIRGDKVRLGIDAPKNVSVHRREVYEAIQNHTPQKTAPEPHPIQEPTQ